MSSGNPAQGDPDVQSHNPDKLNSLSVSLGINAWPYGAAALEEALKVKCEQERTKQEYYRLESRQKVLDILNIAMHLGIPGPAVPILFAGNEDSAAANTSRLATASQAQNAAAAAHHAALQAAVLSPSNVSSGGATALSSHGPFRFDQPGVPAYHLQPPVQPPVQQPQPPQQQQQPQQQYQHQQQAMQAQAGQLKSPITPARTGSIDRSGPSNGSHPNGRRGSPMQQQFQPAFTQAQPNTNSRFDVLSFNRPQETPDRFRLGHRATASSVPAFASESPRAVPPYPPVATAQTSPVHVQPGQDPISSSPYYPSQLSAPSQLLSASSSINSHISHPQMSPQFPQAGSPTRCIQPPRHVPVMSVTPSRPPPVRARGHDATSSTSDLQIHQWKPKQLSRDNRWKVMTSPFGSRSKDKAEIQTGPPPAKIQAQYGTNSTSSGSSEPQVPQSPPSRPPSVSSSTSVIAAQNTKRRGMGHARSRSSVSVATQKPPSQPTSPLAVSRHEEGVAVLANLASEQNKIGYENIKSDPATELLKKDENDSGTHPRLPSLLNYLESQARHLPSSLQRAFPGSAPRDSKSQQDHAMPLSQHEKADGSG